MDRPRAARSGQLTDTARPAYSGSGPEVIDLSGILVDDLLARCHFPAPGAAVVCGVSGGADSTALAALATAAGCGVTLVHVDHGLRPDSARDAEVVARTAARLGARFRTVRVAIEPGSNLEARARHARRASLPPGTLLGHTADDQAETVLLNLLRGSGLDGLSGIDADGRHPILRLRRAETHRLCEELGLETVDDPTNDSPRHRRNRVRHEVLPLLGEVAERDVVPLLNRLADHARDAAAHLEVESATLDPGDARSLAGAPPVLARLAVRRWLRDASPERHPPDAAAVERVLAVAAGECRATEIPGGLRVARRGGRLFLDEDPSSPPEGEGGPSNE